MIRLKSFVTILSLFAAASAGSLFAQSVPVIITVDVNSAAEQYYKVQDFFAELKESEEQAKQKVASMQEEGKTMLAEYEELVAQAESDILTEAARTDAKEDAMAKQNEIQQKENEIRQFVANTQRSFQARQSTQMKLFYQDIQDVIDEIRLEKDADLVIDVSGAKSNGLPTVLYADPSYDITGQVVTRLNANRDQGAAE